MRRRRGFTLIELLVAIALMALLATTVMGAFIMGHRSVRGLDKGLEANQQLRAALKMMTDDMSYARWVSGQNASWVNCYVANDDDVLVNSCEFSVRVYQPKVTKDPMDPYWANFTEWPGELMTYSDKVRVRYRLLNKELIREVYEENSKRVYSSQVLLSGLKEYNEADTGSRLEQLATGKVRVLLRMEDVTGGSTDVATISTILYIR